jgi:hypothetical protein
LGIRTPNGYPKPADSSNKSSNRTDNLGCIPAIYWQVVTSSALVASSQATSFSQPYPTPTDAPTKSSHDQQANATNAFSEQTKPS